MNEDVFMPAFYRGLRIVTYNISNIKYLLENIQKFITAMINVPFRGSIENEPFLL